VSVTPSESGRPVGLRFEGFGWRPAGSRRAALSEVDLSVDAGQRVLVTGPSGAGKSTLLRAAAGLLGTDIEGDMSGRVLVDGAAPGTHPIGLLLQNPADAIVAESVGRDVAFGPENLGVPREEIWRRVSEALELVGFPYDHHTPTRTLSGGETQRMALAGALALRPGLLLLDEPTAMLDPDSAGVVRRAVAAVVAATGATLVVAEHRLEPWLDRVDRVLVLDADGRLICDDTPVGAVTRNWLALERAGLWLPGLPPPRPVPVSADLARPSQLVSGDVMCAEALQLRLRTRSLRGAREQLALAGVDATLTSGRIHAFTGRSGAGKSTLVAALAGLIAPTSGAVRAHPAMAAGLGEHPHRWRSRDLAARLGWVPQNAEHSFVSRRLVDEVRATSDRLGREVDVPAVLETVGLGRLATADPYRLSGGEQRRLALVAALAHRPLVALLDEPTVGQDRHTWAAVVGWMTALTTAGCAVGVATHDEDLLNSVVAESTVLVAGRGGDRR